VVGPVFVVVVLVVRGREVDGANDGREDGVVVGFLADAVPLARVDVDETGLTCDEVPVTPERLVVTSFGFEVSFTGAAF
jgi:hypothetical protein